MPLGWGLPEAARLKPPSPLTTTALPRHAQKRPTNYWTTYHVVRLVIFGDLGGVGGVFFWQILTIFTSHLNAVNAARQCLALARWLGEGCMLFPPHRKKLSPSFPPLRITVSNSFVIHLNSTRILYENNSPAPNRITAVVQEHPAPGQTDHNPGKDLCRGAYTVVITNAVGAVTGAPAILSVIPPFERRLFPGLPLAGEVGTLLNLDCSELLSQEPTWRPLDTATLATSPQFYFDASGLVPPQRFYRAWQPTPVNVVSSLELLRIIST